MFSDALGRFMKGLVLIFQPSSFNVTTLNCLTTDINISVLSLSCGNFELFNYKGYMSYNLSTTNYCNTFNEFTIVFAMLFYLVVN